MENCHGLLMDFTVSLATVRQNGMQCRILGRASGTVLLPAHAGSRLRLRHPRLCAGHPSATGDPVCRTKEVTLGHRQSHDAACRLYGESPFLQAGGGLRLVCGSEGSSPGALFDVSWLAIRPGSHFPVMSLWYFLVRGTWNPSSGWLLLWYKPRAWLAL